MGNYQVNLYLNKIQHSFPKSFNTFDLMKGIGILCVIAGHYVENTRPFVYSFHMPLFFILGGFFFTVKKSSLCISKDFRRLVIPFIITALLISILGFAYAILIKGEDGFEAMKIRILRIIFPSGFKLWFYETPSKYWNAGFMIWFLLALFWCKIIYNELNKHFNLLIVFIICLCVSLTAIYIDNHIFNLPFVILPGCGALVFFASGNVMKNFLQKNNKKVRNLIFCFLLFFGIFWIFDLSLLKREYLLMLENKYDIYILDIISAIGGVSIIWLLCEKIFNKIPFFNIFLSFLGVNSLLILCLHNFDNSLTNGISRGIPPGWLFMISSVIGYVLIVLLFNKIKLIRDLFGIKSWNYSRSES